MIGILIPLGLSGPTVIWEDPLKMPDLIKITSVV